jgi:Ca2+:H+ antiporter
MKFPLWFSAFVVFLPVAFILRTMHQSPPLIFVCSAIAIIPLAGWMGKATEDLSEHLGAGMGGLLNATFGNAAELILGAIALKRGLFSIVKASLTGSIIGNLLLVTGFSLLFGGLRYKKQHFDRTTAGLGSTLMALSAAGMLVPAFAHKVFREEHFQNSIAIAQDVVVEHRLSLLISILLFVVYLLSLFFSFRTNRDPLKESPRGAASHKKGRGAGRAFAWLAGSTVGVAIASELLVGSVEVTAHQWGLTDLFIGVIVVATVGNAAEHSSAVLMALKNKMEVSMAITTGSSLQIALFVAPVLVFLGTLWKQPMDLLFTSFEILSIALAVGLNHLVAQDGESNWFEGVLLLALYVMLGFAFFFLPA